MAFRIAPYPGQTYARPYADHNDVRAYLGWGKLVERPHWASGGVYRTIASRKLPMDFSDTATVPLTDGRTTIIYCAPGNPSTDGWRGKSSTHRTFALCPDCGEMVPAGRTHQHKCK